MWDMKPDAPGRHSRRVQADRDQRAGHSVQRAPAQAGRARAPRDDRALDAPQREQRPRGGRLYQPDRARPGRQHARPSAAAAGEYPAIGSVLGMLRPPEQAIVPHVCLPYITKEGAGGPPQPGFFGGLLGRAYDPLFVLKDPNAADFAVPELTLLADVSVERLAARQALFREIDERFERGPGRSAYDGMDGFRRRALGLLTSERHADGAADRRRAGRGARQLRPQHLRPERAAGAAADRGRHADGHDLLGARRQRHLGHARREFQEAEKHAAAAVRRGLQQPGRAIWPSAGCSIARWWPCWAISAARPRSTPADGGRDHWNYCYSLMLIGGGVKGGFVYGASDKIGAFPARDPLVPGDIVSTIYHLLGIAARPRAARSARPAAPAGAGRQRRAQPAGLTNRLTTTCTIGLPTITLTYEVAPCSVAGAAAWPLRCVAPTKRTRPTYPNHRATARVARRRRASIRSRRRPIGPSGARTSCSGMQQAMGKLPDRSKLAPLDVQDHRAHRGPGLHAADALVRRRSGRSRAVLLVPAQRTSKGKRVPGILALHQTTATGKGQPAGLADSENLHYGLELAKRGYVVLVPDYPSFGDYKYDFNADAYTSGSMKGIFNHMRAVDLLAEPRRRSIPTRIGAIGHSLGGHNAMFVGVFDERIKVIVSSCGWTPLHDYYGGKLAGWTSDRYVPGIRDVYKLDPDKVPFDMYEIVAALAPRAFFSNSPLHDSNFEVAGVRKAIAEARPIYELLGAGREAASSLSRLRATSFRRKVRHEAYQFIDQILEHTPPQGSEGRAAAHSRRTSRPTRWRRFKILPRLSHRAGRRRAAGEQPRGDGLRRGRPAVRRRDARLLGAGQGTARPGAAAGRHRRRRALRQGHDLRREAFLAHGGHLLRRRRVRRRGARHLLSQGHRRRRQGRRATSWSSPAFARSNVQGLFNSFQWGPDNRIHGAASTSGGLVTRPDVPDFKPVSLSGRDFSFDPRTLELRAESGGAQHGMTFDDWGRKFVCSNSDHIQMVMFEDRYLARNPQVSAPSSRMSIAADGPQAEVFRISPVEPWRIVRTRLRVTGAAHGPDRRGRPRRRLLHRRHRHHDLSRRRLAGRVSSANRSPATWAATSCIARCSKPEGVGFVARRADAGKEFVASTDNWFRPAQFANAPDGTLYIIDVYREVIEHPLSLPPEIKKYLDLTSGRDRGRIYRVVPDGFQQQPLPQLAARRRRRSWWPQLESRNGWNRDTAARLLYERQDRAAIGPLEKLAAESKLPQARMHGDGTRWPA